MEEYWTITPKQFQKAQNAYIARTKLELSTQDSLNHILGDYIRIAFNAPKRYPKKPILGKIGEEEKKEMTWQEMERMALINTVKIGGEIRK